MTLHTSKIKSVPWVNFELCSFKHSALMFSYFNNMEYFEEYLAAYDGDCVILIGPVDGKRHCAPEPSYLADAPKHASVWRLAASHDVRSAGEDEVLASFFIEMCNRAYIINTPRIYTYFIAKNVIQYSQISIQVAVYVRRGIKS